MSSKDIHLKRNGSSCFGRWRDESKWFTPAWQSTETPNTLFMLSFQHIWADITKRMNIYVVMIIIIIEALVIIIIIIIIIIITVVVVIIVIVMVIIITINMISIIIIIFIWLWLWLIIIITIIIIGILIIIIIIIIVIIIIIIIITIIIIVSVLSFSSSLPNSTTIYKIHRWIFSWDIDRQLHQLCYATELCMWLRGYADVITYTCPKSKVGVANTCGPFY